MSRTGDFIRHCIEDMGYSEDDIHTASDLDPEPRLHGPCRILVYEADIGPESVAAAAENLGREVGADYLVLSARRSLHIFDLDGDKPVEVGDVESLREGPTKREAADAKHMKEVMQRLVRKYNGRWDEDDLFSNLYSMAALACQMDRDGGWAEAEKLRGLLAGGTTGPGAERASADARRLLSEASKKAGERCPGLVVSAGWADSPEGALGDLLLFSGVRFSSPSRCPAEVCRHLARKETRAFISRHLARLLMGFAREGGEVVSVDAPALIAEGARRGLGQTYCTDGPEDLARLTLFLCGARGELELGCWGIDGMYGSVVAVPPYGEKCGYTPGDGDPVFRSGTVDLQFLVLKKALSSILPGGVVAALVSGAVLFREHEALESMVGSRRVAAIVELDKPFGQGTSVNGYLVVIRDGETGPAMVSRGPVSPAEYLDLAADLESFMEGGAGVEGLRLDYRALERERFSRKSWLPDSILGSEAEDETDGVRLGDVCEIITGVNEPSDRQLGPEAYGGMSYLKVSAIVDGGLDLASCPKVPAEYARTTSRPGDVVVSVSGKVGKVAIVRDEVLVPCAQVFILRCIEGRCTPEGLIGALRTEKASERMRAAASGARIPHISKAALAGVRLPRGG